MSGSDTARSIADDKAASWHPFTQMRDWCAPEHEPVVLVEGRGAILKDSEGREYIDGNSSIWTNIHGHRHPRIDAAIRDQLGRVAHTSFLGFTHPLAARLGRELTGLFPPNTLTRVFFSDDGATAVEVAVKMAIQYWQLLNRPARCRFIAFSGAYHGDTMGASSLGSAGGFHDRFGGFQFPVRRVASLAELSGPEIDSDQTAAVIIEPLIQGAAGMRLWPAGMLRELRAWCDRTGVLLILDEVMTGFGRTGTLFACEREEVVPDFIAVAKGLTGGYLPLAATLTTESIYSAFLGESAEGRTFYYGHSYTANPLGCAAALASLEVFREERVLETLQPKISLLSRLLAGLSAHPNVAEIRQCGFITGIELKEKSGAPFDWKRMIGAKVCVAARRHGLLTRPILDTIVIMPPYCITEEEIRRVVDAVQSAIEEVCA